MTARLLVLALALVALTTQPLAFDLLGLKRALFLAATSALLLLPAMQAALVRTLGGAARSFVLTAGAFGIAAAIVLARQPLGAGERVVVVRAVVELLLFALTVVLAREVAWERGETIARGVIWIGTAAAAIALCQVAGFDPIYGRASLRAPVATFGNTNAFAAFAAPCLAVAVARAARRSTWLALLATTLLAAALLLARGRGGWLAGSVGVVVALIVSARTAGVAASWKRAVLALVAGVALGGALDYAVAHTSGELSSKPLGLGLERSSNKIRIDVARATLDLIALHPLAGCGPGRFRDDYPLVRREREARTPTREGAASEVSHPHCEPLRLVAEGGAPTGLLALLALLGAARSLWKNPRTSRRDDGTLRAAFAAGGAAWLASSLTWSTLHDPSTALLGALLAGGALAGDVEMAIVRPRERPLAWLATALLVAAGFVLAAPTLGAELIEWRTLRNGSLDAADLTQLQRAATLDAWNLERQYAVGMKQLQAARLDPSGGDRFLGNARSCLRRALELVPRHVASLDALAEVEARAGDEAAARAALERAHALEPWRGSVDARLAELLADAGHELAGARARLEAEGDAAIAPLFAQAKELRARNRNRPAAQLLDLIAPRAPEDGDLWRELALALQALGDESGYRRAYRKSQIAYALAALAEGSRSEEARTNLNVARRCAPGADAKLTGDAAAAEAAATALEELLEACVDLQRSRVDAARERLARLDPAAALAAAQTATPTAVRLFRMLSAQPTLKLEVERLGLDRISR